MSRLHGSDRPDHAARELIDAYLIDDLDEAGARTLADHVRGCPECAAELGGSTRLMELLRTLPEPVASPDLDTRIFAAVLADRRRREEGRSWLANLPRQVFRGAMRTTGTLMVTAVTVALVGGAFVFAASQFIAPPPHDTAGGTLPPVATPTAAPTETTHVAAPTASPTSGSPTEPAPTTRPTPAATPLVTDELIPQPTPSASPEPTASPVPTAPPPPLPSESPTLSPSPSVEPSAPPSPVITPEPSAPATPTASPSPSPTTSPTASPSPSPSPTPDASGTPKPRRTPPPSSQSTGLSIVTPAPSAAVAPGTSP